MTHELFALMRENPFGTFLLLICLIWAIERVVVAFLHRNRPTCDCECCEPEVEDEEDE